jgi:hypothetical protein
LKTYRTNFTCATFLESLDLIRAERDQILADTVDRMNPMRWNSLTDEKKAEWTNYRTQLLTITNRIARTDYVVWPQIPSDKDEPVVMEEVTSETSSEDVTSETPAA